MKNNARKIALLSAIAAGVAGMAGTASAQQFSIGATVQNAITLTQTTPLDFGTIFATTTATGTAGPLTATASEKLTLSPAGAVTLTAGGADGGSILSLLPGTAGAYSAPGLPGNSTVLVSFLTAADTAFTPAGTVAAAACVYDTPAAAITASKIVLQNTITDPTLGFFCVDVFTSNRTGLFAGGYSLGFGVTELTFNLGATIVAQAPATLAMQRNFQPGTYTGSFGMEVSFP